MVSIFWCLGEHPGTNMARDLERCASRHSAIHPKGVTNYQTGENKGRPNPFKSWQQSD